MVLVDNRGNHYNSGERLAIQPIHPIVRLLIQLSETGARPKLSTAGATTWDGRNASLLDVLCVF
jgi:hypothetical protein